MKKKQKLPNKYVLAIIEDGPLINFQSLGKLQQLLDLNMEIVTLDVTCYNTENNLKIQAFVKNHTKILQTMSGSGLLMAREIGIFKNMTEVATFEFEKNYLREIAKEKPLVVLFEKARFLTRINNVRFLNTSEFLRGLRLYLRDVGKMTREACRMLR